jgi:nucleotide-binding universal stress UspA family protein
VSPLPNVNLPAPSAIRRDGDGRLTNVVLDSTPPPAATAIHPWLIAVDASPPAQRAVAEALRLGRTIPDCAFHLVHVVSWLSKEAAETELVRRAWAATRAVRQALDDAGQPWRLHVAMGNSAGNIVNVAAEQGCRGIVIGRRGLGCASGQLLGSVSGEVIQHSPVPVLVVP